MNIYSVTVRTGKDIALGHFHRWFFTSVKQAEEQIKLWEEKFPTYEVSPSKLVEVPSGKDDFVTWLNGIAR